MLTDSDQFLAVIPMILLVMQSGPVALLWVIRAPVGYIPAKRALSVSDRVGSVDRSADECYVSGARFEPAIALHHSAEVTFNRIRCMASSTNFNYFPVS